MLYLLVIPFLRCLRTTDSNKLNVTWSLQGKTYSCGVSIALCTHLHGKTNYQTVIFAQSLPLQLFCKQRYAGTGNLNQPCYLIP